MAGLPTWLAWRTPMLQSVVARSHVNSSVSGHIATRGELVMILLFILELQAGRAWMLMERRVPFLCRPRRWLSRWWHRV